MTIYFPHHKHKHSEYPFAQRTNNSISIQNTNMIVINQQHPNSRNPLRTYECAVGQYKHVYCTTNISIYGRYFMYIHLTQHMCTHVFMFQPNRVDTGFFAWAKYSFFLPHKSRWASFARWNDFHSDRLGAIGGKKRIACLGRLCVRRIYVDAQHRFRHSD